LNSGIKNIVNIASKYKRLCKLVNDCPKGIDTNWFVVTGAPSSGKTTLLQKLANNGYKVNPDASRQLLELRVKSGLQPEQVRADEKQFQIELLDLMVDSDLRLNPNDLIFHEYALPDNVAFWRKADLKLPDVLIQSVKLFKYRSVFILEPLALKRDGIRTETEADQKAIHKLILESYREAGYNPILIPAGSVESRLEKVLNHLPV
jgi:predicted ATPase